MFYTKIFIIIEFLQAEFIFFKNFWRNDKIALRYRHMSIRETFTFIRLTYIIRAVIK